MKYLLALLSFSLCLPILAAVDGESTAGGLAVETDPVWTSVSNNYATGEHTVNTDEQDLSISGDSLSLTGDPTPTPVDLSGYLDNTDDQNASEVSVVTPFDGNLTPGATSVEAALQEVDNLVLGGGAADGYIGDVQAHTAGGSLDMAGNEISNASTVTVTGTGSDIVFYSENFDSVNLVTKNFVGSEPEIVTDDETWQYSDFDPNIWQNIGGVLQVSYVGSLADNGSTPQGYGPAALCLNLKERGFRRDHGALRVKFDYTHSRTVNSGSDVLEAFIYLLKYGENATGGKNLSNLGAGRAGNMWTQAPVNGDVAGGLDYNWHVYNMASSDGSGDPAAPDGNFTGISPGHRTHSYQIPLTAPSASGTVDLTFDLSNLDLSGGAQTLPVVNSLYTTGDPANNGEYEIVNAGGNVDSFMGTPSLADFDYIQVAITMRDDTGDAPSIVFDATATIDNLELTAVSTSGNLELTGVGATENFSVVKTLNANVAEPITDFNAEGIIRVPVDQYPVVKYVQTGNIVFDWFSTAATDLAECVVLLETDLGGSAIDFGTITWASGGPPTYGPATLNMFHVRVHNGVVKAVDIGAF